MHKTVSSLLLVGALVFNLAACSTAATNAVLPRAAEEKASCREPGRADGKALQPGQSVCAPQNGPVAPAGK